jgi:hypothetical protein
MPKLLAIGMVSSRPELFGKRSTVFSLRKALSAVFPVKMTSQASDWAARLERMQPAVSR